jgi:ankyrin repeat protein
VAQLGEEIRAETLSAGLRESSRSANGGRDVVKFIFDNGADRNIAGTAGNTPVMIAAREGRVDKLAFLVSHAGSSVRYVDLNHRNKTTGETALHLACKSGNLDAIKALLPPNVNPGNINLGLRDRKGKTPFQILCETENMNGIDEFLKHLDIFSVDRKVLL